MINLQQPVWSLVYVFMATAISWALRWPRFPGLPFVPLGVALFVFGWIPPVWAIVLFRRERTVVSPTSLTNCTLVTSPYRFTRNSMYLGLVMITLGIAIWVGAWPMFIAPIAIFATANWVHIPFEEAKMGRQFGATYDRYNYSGRAVGLRRMTFVEDRACANDAVLLQTPTKGRAPMVKSNARIAAASALLMVTIAASSTFAEDKG